MKKHLSNLCLIMFAFVAVLFFAKPVEAANTSGFYEYSIKNYAEKTAVITKYNGDEINCVIPSKLDGYKVVELGGGSFQNKVNMTTVKIPSTVTTMSWGVFKKCTALKSVTIPDSVTSMSFNCFEGCTALESAVVGKGLTVLPEKTFVDCTALKSVKLSYGLEVIGSYSFDNCIALPSITIPNSVTTISFQAFNDCESFTELVIPDSVTTIKSLDWESEATLGSCSNLKKIVFGKNVQSIPMGCCRGNTSLTTVEFRGTAVTSIGDSAFTNCKSLTTFVFPANVESVGSYAFSNCTSLTNITLNEGLGTIEDNCFYKCTSLTEITLPKSVDNLSKDLFSGCTSLKTVRFYPCYNISTSSVDYIGTADHEGLTVYCYNNSQFLTNLKKYAEKYTVVELTPTVATKLTLNKTQVALLVGDGTFVTATLTPAGATDSVYWQTSNAKIATVSQKGYVKAVSEGSVVVTAKTNTGQVIAQVNVTCQKAPTKLEVNTTSKKRAVGQSFTIKAEVDGGSRTDITVTWTSSDPSVATVNAKGKVTAKKAGKAVITASTYNGLKATCTVTVKKAPSKITLKKKTVTLKVKKSTTLKYTITKNSYTSKLTWTSSNKKIATVNSKGKVTAKKAGKCKITVKTHNGKKATCTIKVKK